MELMLLKKIDGDMVLLTDSRGTFQWAHISALKVPTSYTGIVAVDWYENLYSRQIEAIKAPQCGDAYTWEV